MGESYPLKAAIGGISCASVAAVLNPLDVARIRLQLQAQSHNGYVGMIPTVMKIWREEGIRGWSKGLTPSLMRELFYSSIRMGAYEPIKASVPDIYQSSPLTKLGCGLVAGGIGAALANPLDLIKTRFQSILPQECSPYKGTFDAFRKIIAQDGLRGLYKGWHVTCIRAAILNSAQIGSYDVIKNNLLIGYFGMENGFVLHLVSSFMAGLVTTTAANPVDVIKTRYLSDRNGFFHGPIDCVTFTLKQDGFSGFMKGWVPNYWRLGTHTVFALIMIENLRLLFGLNPI